MFSKKVSFDTFLILCMERPLLAPDASSEKPSQRPTSFGGYAEMARTKILSEEKSFALQFHDAMHENERLLGILKGLQEVMKECIRYLDNGRIALTQKFGLSEEKVAKKMAAKRKERDKDLLIEDFDQVRKFYDEVAQRLEEKGENTNGVTEYKRRLIAKGELYKKPFGAYIKDHFDKEIDHLLDSPYDKAAHNALVRKIENAMLGDPSVPDTDKGLGLKMKIRGAFDEFDLYEAEKGTLPLSKDAVYGMLGRVLSREDMMRVFIGDLALLRDLPDGSVSVSFADRNVVFYHKKGQQVPNEIVELMSSKEMPMHILLTRYRTDDDVRKLFIDMSDGQILEGRMCDGDQCVTIKGRSDSSDIDIDSLPDSVKKEEFMDSPMKYLKHDLLFRVGQKSGEAKKEDDPDTSADHSES